MALSSAAPRAAFRGALLGASAVVMMVLASQRSAAGPPTAQGAALEAFHAPPEHALGTEAKAALSPMGLAAKYVTIDISRWLWWPVILYLFWGMAFVCDVYFVRTIDVIAERFQIPDDVAGATLMALGCNGPELALNAIAIFHPSNIGVGAVVGGEVFNVLVIIGTALLATPDMYMPLKLGPFMFFRDVIFYIVSVGLLYWVLHDGEVSRVNALVLLAGAVVYTTTVVFSSQLSRCFARDATITRLVRSTTARLTRTTIGFLPSLITGNLQYAESAEDSDEEDSEDEPDPETLEQWQEACKCAIPSEGSVLGVRVDVRNRLMDRSHRVDDRYMWLRDDALLVSTVVDPRPGKHSLQRAITGIVYDHNARTKDQHWHHGGLVNQPLFLNEQVMMGVTPRPSSDEVGKSISGAFSATPISQLSRPFLNETKSKSEVHIVQKSPPPIDVPGFREAPWEVIPLEDFLYCERVEEQNLFNLHVHRHDSKLGSLITLEVSAPCAAVVEAWVEALRGRILAQRRRSADAPPAKRGLALWMEWVEWLQFPVKFMVAQTIPDMDDPKLQHLYPVSFVMSMAWLAIFAFSVCNACDGISADFGISTTVLGFTVAAAGTSFPNVISGMCVAKQGKTSMAIANALGANVQNVFLALAVPWCIQSFLIVGGPFPMVVDALIPAVLACAITLVPVLLVYVCCSYSMPRWSGGLFLFTYVVYVVFALGQQVTNCAIWPLPCSVPAAAA